MTAITLAILFLGSAILFAQPKGSWSNDWTIDRDVFIFIVIVMIILFFGALVALIV